MGTDHGTLPDHVFTRRPGQTLPSAVQDCLELSICILAGQERPEHIMRLEREAARWARDGIPIDTILRLVHDGVRLAVDLVAGATRMHLGPAPVRLQTVDADLVLGLLNTITTTIAGAYAQQLQFVVVQQQHAAHDLTTALLEGRSASVVTRHAGLAVSAEYWVLALALLRPPDTTAPAIAPDILTAQPLRRVKAELAQRYRGAALEMLSRDGGTVLLPAELADDPSLDRLIADLAGTARVPVTVIVTRAITTEIPAAAERAHELLDLAVRLDMTGARRFDDLALEYQLTRPGPGLDQLSALLDPLDDHPELLTTLRCYIACEQSRKRTATRLHLHPNSVDYRLKRIAQLTGLDVARASGLWYLRSVVVARSHRNSPPRRSASGRIVRRA